MVRRRSARFFAASGVSPTLELQFDAGALGEVGDGFGEVEGLEVHDELDGVAASLAVMGHTHLGQERVRACGGDIDYRYGLFSGGLHFLHDRAKIARTLDLGVETLQRFSAEYVHGVDFSMPHTIRADPLWYGRDRANPPRLDAQAKDAVSELF